MTKAEVKKKHNQLRQLRDKVCLLAEDADAKSDKARKEADQYEKIMGSLNVTLDALEVLM